MPSSDERLFRALEAKYAEYKRREANYRARAGVARAQDVGSCMRSAEREMWKAHGIGIAIVLFRMHAITPASAELPIPETAAGGLDTVPADLWSKT